MNAVLVEKILFGKITRISDPKMSKMLVWALCGKEKSAFHSGP